MNEDWVRPRVREDFGDALPVCGVFGLVAGIVFQVPWLGVIVGLIAGTIVDGVAGLREARDATVPWEMPR